MFFSLVSETLSLLFIITLILFAVFYPSIIGKKWSIGEVDGYRIGMTGVIGIYVIFNVLLLFLN